MMVGVRRWFPMLFAAALMVVIPACDSDPAETDDPAALVVGDYIAEEELGAFRLTTLVDGVETDWLAQGAIIEMTLHANGTTTGRMFIPGADEDGGDFEADLTGTFTVTGSVVEFDHAADTFIRDMPFTWVDGRLTGDRTFSETRVVLELIKR